MQPQIKTLQIIHFALCAGLILAYVLVGELTSLSAFTLPEITMQNIIYTFIPIIAFIVGNLLFKMQLKGIDKKQSLEANLPQYQMASIMRYAILEGSAFIILFIQKDFMLFGLLIIAYLIFLRPSKQRMESDIEMA